MSTLGYVNKLESFGLVDGPGIRFIVFLQGCDMRCQFCHNPETWAKNVEETPIDKVMKMTPEETLTKAMRYKTYWKANGGITVSGGEPLLQMDYVIELFRLAKAKGVSTVIDTSGNPFTMEESWLTKFNELMKVTDLFMLDIKHTDKVAHKNLTGQENVNIMDMAKYLAENGKDMWIRRVLVPGISDDEKELAYLKTFIDSLGDAVKRVEILPYHTLALEKWEKLGITYPLDGVPTPTKEEVEKAEKILGIENDDQKTMNTTKVEPRSC